MGPWHLQQWWTDSQQGWSMWLHLVRANAPPCSTTDNHQVTMQIPVTYYKYGMVNVARVVGHACSILSQSCQALPFTETAQSKNLPSYQLIGVAITNTIQWWQDAKTLFWTCHLRFERQVRKTRGRACTKLIHLLICSCCWSIAGASSSSF